MSGLTRDDIIRMAREAGFNHEGWDWDEVVFPIVERFAVLVAATEREACANVADEHMDGTPEWNSAANNIASAIRARGNDAA